MIKTLRWKNALKQLITMNRLQRDGIVHQKWDNGLMRKRKILLKE